ncbi:MAG: ComEC/Rec2 family competence protein [Prevotellamassilia sp.]
MARAGYRFLSRVVVPFFTISLSAQLGTAPFVVYYFHQLPLYGLVGNILVIPLAYFLLSGVLLFFLIPSEAVSAALAHLLSAALQLLTEGLQALSQWPGANLTLYLHP